MRCLTGTVQGRSWSLYKIKTETAFWDNTIPAWGVCPGLRYHITCPPLREGNGHPLQYSCLENPVDRGAWWAAVHGDAQSRTLLKWLSMHACIGEGNGHPLQYSCLENPRDRGAWWVAVYGVAQSWTRLKWLSSSSGRSPPLSHSWYPILERWCNNGTELIEWGGGASFPSRVPD